MLDVIQRVGAITLVEWRLTDVSALEIGDAAGRGQGGIRLAGIDLAGRGDRLDPRRLADVAAQEPEPLCDRVRAAIGRSGMQIDSHAHVLSQPLVGPARGPSPVSVSALGNRYRRSRVQRPPRRGAVPRERPPSGLAAPWSFTRDLLGSRGHDELG